ncbi:MAG: hypothetical protein EXR70_16020 [Deltaproteobacteria bacterium]|nr:hypothetical protein [Deltaproteobacteria bacterium]
MKLIDTIAARRWLAVLIVGLLAFSGSVTIGLIGGIAVPKEHDEFSYLLAADTFRQGRLTNPTHPMWIHFESIHIIHQPTYMAKYPPGPGAMLALGQLLSGYPIVGVWLSMGLMGAAICWMLQAWVPPRWALIGGLFSLLHPIVGIGADWAQGYWRGALAAAGGALVLGACRYLLKQPSVLRAVLMGVGLTILANTRPYEGLLVGIGAGVTLVLGFLRQRDFALRVLIKKVVLPLVVTCALSAAWMAYYNFCVTGNIFRLPYQVHETAYGVAPLFVWQEPTSVPVYRHPRLDKLHTSHELAIYRAKHSLTGFAADNADALLMYAFFVGNIFLVPFVINLRPWLRWLLRNRWTKSAVAIYFFVTVGLMAETYYYLHYWAPVLALNYYFTVQALRIWCRRDRRLRPYIVPVMLALVAMLMLIVARQRIKEQDNPLSAASQRAALMARWQQQPGKQLVLIRYDAEANDLFEWVYNDADIDNAKVVWARAMEPSANCKLADYFKDHEIWSLTVGAENKPVEVNPFPRQACQ